MRHIGSKRRRSRVWWGVFLCAVLAMGAYIVFDMLDLDGSSLRDAWAGSAIAAEAVGGETERLLPPTEAAPHATVLGSAVGALWLDPLSCSFRRPAPALRLGVLHSHTLPRTNLAKETSSTTSPSADPA
jgi:hypothetical protein